MNISKLLILTMVVSTASAFSPRGGMRFERNDLYIGQQVKTDLTEEQKASLYFMWEEEKVARDVYLVMADKYKRPRVFANIAKSEQSHMNAVAGLLRSYNLPVPTTNGVGDFETQEFKDLFDSLVARGLKSKNDALQVGVDIEILDIQDLQDRLEGATDQMKLVYENLIIASYRHKAAFERQLP